MKREIINCPAEGVKVNKAVHCPEDTCDDCTLLKSKRKTKKKKARKSKKRGIVSKRSPKNDSLLFTEALDTLTHLPPEHYELRNRIIEAMQLSRLEGGDDSNKAVILCLKKMYDIKKTFGEEATDRMTMRVCGLWDILDIFNDEVEKAKRNHNTLFLNTVREVFREDAKYYIEGKKGKGRKIDKKVMSERNQMFWKFVRREISYDDLPKTFSTRIKPQAICLLAYHIHLLFDQPLKRHIRESKRMILIARLQNIIRKCGIVPDEIFPYLTFTDTRQIDELVPPQQRKRTNKKQILTHMRKYMDTLREREETIKKVLAALESV